MTSDLICIGRQMGEIPIPFKVHKFYVVDNEREEEYVVA